MRHLSAIIIALLVAVAPSGGRAATLDFTFVFTNRALGYPGTITGIVRGLADNATSAASSLEILSNTDGFGLGEYVGAPGLNSWTVTGGEISAFVFRFIGAQNAEPAVTCCSLHFNSSVGNGTALFPTPGGGGSFSATPRDIVFTAVATAVPEPASALLLGSALGLGLMFSRRRIRAN